MSEKENIIINTEICPVCNSDMKKSEMSSPHIVKGEYVCQNRNCNISIEVE